MCHALSEDLIAHFTGTIEATRKELPQLPFADTRRSLRPPSLYTPSAMLHGRDCPHSAQGPPLRVLLGPLAMVIDSLSGTVSLSSIFKNLLQTSRYPPVTILPFSVLQSRNS